MKKHSLAINLCFLLLSFSSTTVLAEAYGSGWYQELQLSAEHEDNVSRSYKKEDLVSDLISSVSYGGGYSSKYKNKGQWIVSGYVTYSDYQDYDDLDNIALNAEANWTYQPTNAYAANWYNFNASATTLQYRNSEAREGTLFEIDTNINRRLTTSVVGHFGYRYSDMVFIGKDKDEKERDAAFDVSGHELYLGIDLQLSKTIFLFTEYGYRHGDITSTVSGAIDPDAEYDAETIDTVFDPCDDITQCAVRYAYRVVADTQRLNLGIAFAIKKTNMDFTASYYDAESENGKNYENWMIKFGLVRNF